MYICKTSIVGTLELANVDPSSQANYDKAMTPSALKDCGIVIASLTVEQKESIKFLLKNGFLQIGKAKKNPNSGNMILLFVKFIRNNTGI